MAENNYYPNTFQVPNILIDDDVTEDWHESEFRVFLYFARQLSGWHKEKDWCTITHLANEVSLSRGAISGAIKRLVEQGVIIAKDEDDNILETPKEREGVGRNHGKIYYTINIYDGVHQNEQAVHQNEQDAVHQNEPTKTNKLDKTNNTHFSLSKKYNSNTPLTAKGVDYDAVKTMWNQGVPENLQIQTITSKRKKHLRARFKEKLFDLDAIIDALANQPFCLGENDRGWVADFNWIIKNDENYVKVLEYNYGSDDNNGSVDQLDGLKSKYGGG